MKKLVSIAAGCLLLGAAPSFAADVYTPPAEAPAEAPKPPAYTWTIGFETSPEFSAITDEFKDELFKGSISHSFGGGWSLGAAFQDKIKVAPGAYQYYVEAVLGYKFKFGDFSLAPSVVLGTTWGATGFTGDDSDEYWAVNLAGDWKLSDHWTWNVFSARYRDAFTYDYRTPKVSTGVTYKIGAADSVYTNVGYEWKNGFADKYAFTFGYKHSFAFGSY